MNSLASIAATQPVLDIHAHMAVPSVTEWAKPHLPKRIEPSAELVTEEMRRAMAAWGAKTRAPLLDVNLRLALMDGSGVDVQALSAMTVTGPTYWAPGSEALGMEQRLNEAIAGMVADHPSRFCGLGGAPLQDPALAVKELRRCVNDLGFLGLQISTCAGDMELGDRRLWPFWEEAEALGAFIYIHPSGTCCGRMAKWQIWNSIGQPLEEALAMASLMYEGVLDAFPALKIGIAHGGGYLPYYVGRLDRNFHDKPLTRVNMKRTPSEYLKLFYYDSCVFDTDILESLVRKVGVDRVVLGSDFPVGEAFPVDFVRQAAGLTEAQQDRIIRGTGAELLSGRRRAGAPPPDAAPR